MENMAAGQAAITSVPWKGLSMERSPELVSNMGPVTWLAGKSSINGG